MNLMSPETHRGKRNKLMLQVFLSTFLCVWSGLLDFCSYSVVAVFAMSVKYVKNCYTRVYPKVSGLSR
jgi:hypothetical protein